MGDKPPTTEADLETQTGKEEPCALEERTLYSLILPIGVQRNGQSQTLDVSGIMYVSVVCATFASCCASLYNKPINNMEYGVQIRKV